MAKRQRPTVYCVEIFVPTGDKDRAAPHWKRLDCFVTRGARAQQLVDALTSDPGIMAQITEE
jgi:hypothetical protein